jgi:acyl-[acyl-carrier-protein]-phospholipid O-acyltransferase/long-chain-fatty-acid--[acyl-carrier-protein] ligase
MVGIMLPASVAGVISNVAIGLAGKTSVNLNFKAGNDAISKSIARCEIKTIITSKRFVQKAGLNTLKEFVYMEDIVRKTKLATKIGVSVSALLFPASLLTAIYYRKNYSQDDIATVIFSSGSTGDPKGIMLSHANIISNQEMASQVLHHRSDDRIIGSLPFFHSFGYTMTLWFPLLKGIFTAYVPNPLDAKKVGTMAGKYQATIMFGTPTFYNLYTRECKPQQFSHIRLAIAGAERLPKSVADSFMKKFGRSLIQGYGVTEMAPIISCNVPDYVKEGIFQKGRKAGSVGITLPGVSAKIVELDNYYLELSSGKEGMLLVKGPNRMMGYLKDENRTKEALHRDWYITGDLAKIDDDGFIYIVGRLSRFSKIGGEMVPHVQVEDKINKTLGFEKQRLIVTSVKDNVKGERLVVLHLPEVSSHINRREIKGKLRNAGLPNLWIPRDFYEVQEFPLLASGKLDLKALSTIAQKTLNGANNV